MSPLQFPFFISSPRSFFTYLSLVFLSLLFSILVCLVLEYLLDTAYLVCAKDYLPWSTQESLQGVVKTRSLKRVLNGD